MWRRHRHAHTPRHVRYDGGSAGRWRRLAIGGKTANEGTRARTGHAVGAVVCRAADDHFNGTAIAQISHAIA